MVHRVYANYPSESGAGSIPSPNSFSNPQIVAQGAVAKSVTGTLAETTLLSVTIPANSMGPNGSIRITSDLSVTNNANVKVLTTKLNGISVGSLSIASFASYKEQRNIYNRGNTGSQVSHGGTSSGMGGSGATLITMNVDTTKDQVLSITGTLANIGDVMTLESYTIEVLPGA